MSVDKSILTCAKLSREPKACPAPAAAVGICFDNTDTTSIIVDYVNERLKRTKEDPDVKGSTTKVVSSDGSTNANDVKGMQKLHLSRALTGKSANVKGNSRKVSDPVEVFLIQSGSITTAANTANTPNVTISPVGAQDYSNFAAVFDEVRVRRIDYFISMTSSAPSPPAVGYAAFAHDPANFAAYSNPADVLSAEHCIGPFSFTQQNAAGGYTAYPVAMTSSGFWKMSVPLHPTRLTNDGGAATSFGGGWLGTSIGTAVVAILKGYIPSFGAGNTSTMNYVARMHCEFRSRT
jgi:hypothetical protein